MRILRALLAGIVGCAVLVGILWLTARLVAPGIDVCMLAGALVTGRTDLVGWLAGFGVQLVIAVVAAFVYAAIFEWVTRRAGVIVGLAVATAHVIVAGLSVGFLPADSLIASGLAPTGAFFEYEGAWAVVAFVSAHLAFGAVVGAFYGTTRHQPPVSGRVWLDVSHDASRNRG